MLGTHLVYGMMKDMKDNSTTRRKPTKNVIDSRGVIWTIYHSPSGWNSDAHQGRNTAGRVAWFQTRSGALKWLKRESSR